MRRAKLASHDENILNNYIEEILNNYNEIIINIDKYNNENTEGALLYIRTLTVGPSFRGKTHLLINKSQLIRLCDSEKQIKIITRSLEQYANTEIEDISMEEDLEGRTIQDFQNCCVVLDDMLDSSRKLQDSFFTRGRHYDLDVHYLSQSYFESSKRTIRNISNKIILSQQTLNDVEHTHRDIAGFGMP